MNKRTLNEQTLINEAKEKGYYQNLLCHGKNSREPHRKFQNVSHANTGRERLIRTRLIRSSTNSKFL